MANALPLGHRKLVNPPPYPGGGGGGTVGDSLDTSIKNIYDYMKKISARVAEVKFQPGQGRPGSRLNGLKISHVSCSARAENSNWAESVTHIRLWHVCFHYTNENGVCWKHTKLELVSNLR